MTPELLDLHAYIAGNGIEHFSGPEVCPVGRPAGDSLLRMAPRALWPNIIPTLLLLEELRAHFGHPVEVLSGYRSPAYNRAVGGARESMHLSFNAIDFRCGHVDPLVAARWLHAHPLAALLGIGRYTAFTHLDTRGKLGRAAPARWAGDNEMWWV